MKFPLSNVATVALLLLLLSMNPMATTTRADTIIDTADVASTLDPYAESVPTSLSNELGINLDLSKLGTEGLDAYSGQMSIEIGEDGDCQYTFTVEFIAPNDLPPGTADFQGNCDPTTQTQAPNGQPYHGQTQYWAKLSKPMIQATGIHHISIQWKPCGDEEQTLRQPRFDVVYYYVPPEYRTIMDCPANEIVPNQFPETCQEFQTTPKGRAMFTLPVLWRDVNRIANMPINFFPTTKAGRPYEGLLSFNPNDQFPESPSVPNPIHQMSSYDGDVISSRMVLPYQIFGEDMNIASSNSGGHTYASQTKKRLFTKWATEFNQNNDRTVRVRIEGSSGLCKAEYDAMVAAEAAEEAA
mmetsp:Transcript_14321/g.40755  ORF Transcript_14321/g.40755 Transcript_14321/m.40755 type:complete len:355 (+) Transcript_14321:102-1166(+)